MSALTDSPKGFFLTEFKVTNAARSGLSGASGEHGNLKQAKTIPH